MKPHVSCSVYKRITDCPARMDSTPTDTTINIVETACDVFDTTTAIPESLMSKLNHILYLQENIKIECKSVIDTQSQTEDPKQFMEHQTLLNNLFVQHIDMGLKAASLIAAENLKSDTVPSLSAESSCDDSVAELAPATLVRTLSVSDEVIN